MRYVCSICGYVYDEEVEGTPFSELPDTWTCPLCGAAKSAFEPERATADTAPSNARAAAAETSATDTPPAPAAAATASASASLDHDLTELPAGVLAAICSNLARGCEKQYLAEESALFGEFATYFTARAAAEPGTDDARAISELADRFQRDLDAGYPALRSAAEGAADRGTLRICTWGEKVTRTLASLAERYRREGPAMLDGARIWVCSVCGFTFVGERPPALCPVCKVPDWKFDEIRGRAA
ncbi:rubredoxin-like domain-containing protein [Collinsella sp. An268]|uniref:rubredoxin-like domain-containing protein n=1 Tax=Collinsella sp. An268 TaxID=1965612 RepID=UPI000B37B0C7|nr:hypothetical protein B5F70_07375 [Collinsella sp. An268]